MHFAKYSNAIEALTIIGNQLVEEGYEQIYPNTVHPDRITYYFLHHDRYHPRIVTLETIS